MRNIARWLMLVVLASPAVYAEVRDSAGPAGEEMSERELSVAAVPPKVLAVAQRAKPGGYIVRVTQRYEEDDNTYFDFDVSQVGKYWVVTVRADATLIIVSEEGEPPNLNAD